MLKYKSNAGTVAAEVDELAGLIRDPSPVLRRLGLRMVNESIPANFRAEGRPEKWAGIRRKGRIQQDTRHLLRSIQWEQGGGVLRVGTNLEYAAQRHFGGVIKAKDKALAVPLDPRGRKKPSDYENLRWAPAKNARPGVRGFLVEPDGYKGRKGHRKPVYRYRFILLAKIEQPARPFLMFQPEDIAFAEAALAQHLMGRR